MEKCIVWYKLLLKIYVKKKSYWFQMVGMLLAITLIMMISIPDSSNVKVGLYFDKGDMAKQIESILMTQESVFSFVCYDDADELKNKVITGELECAFLFDKEFEEKVHSGNLKKSITYIASSFSTKGEVAKEVIYTALLEIYSDEILRRVDADIYEEADPVRLEKLLEKKDYYLNSGELFQLETKEVNVFATDVQNAGSERVNNLNIHNAVNTVKGMIGLFVFLTAFFAYGNKLREDVSCVCKKLTFKENIFFSFVNSLVAGTIPMILGLLLLFVSEGMNKALSEMLKMLLFLILTALWVAVVGILWNNMERFFAWILPILICNVLLCPIFFDLGQYISALKYLRILFPLGIYLSL